MALLDGGGDGNTLGRREHDRSKALKAERSGHLPWRRFFDRTSAALSVDLFAPGALRTLTNLASAQATEQDRTFYGWGCLTREDAERNGRRVIASPTDENACHGDIQLPRAVEDDDDERKRHAQELADATEWWGVRVP